jgi:tetratricopeptide (TPR) repeat protein
MSADLTRKLLNEYLRKQAGGAVVRIRDADEPKSKIFTGSFISPAGHLLTSYHALEARLMDATFRVEFDVAFEFDPIWFPRETPTSEIVCHAFCEPGWRDPEADIAIVKLDHMPAAFLPIATADGSNNLLGSALVSYGFTIKQSGTASIGEIEGRYLRALPETRRFRVSGIVTSIGHSGGPVLNIASRCIVGAVVGFWQQEINSGDAAAISRNWLSERGVTLDFDELERTWLRGAADYIVHKHPEFLFLLSELRVPQLPDRHLPDRAIVQDIAAELDIRRSGTLLLHGAPGSGKSSVALELASRVRDAGIVDCVYWHDFYAEEARSAQRLIREMGIFLLEHAGVFDIVEGYSGESSFGNEDHAIATIAENLGRCLPVIVFDNVHFLYREKRTTAIDLVNKVMQVAARGAALVILTSWDPINSPLVDQVRRLDGFSVDEVARLLRIHDIETSPDIIHLVEDYRHDVTCLQLLVRNPEWIGGLDSLDQRPVEPAELHKYWLERYREHLPPAAQHLLMALAVLDDPSGEEAVEEVAEISDFRVIASALRSNPPLIESYLQEGSHTYYLHHNVKRAFLAISDAAEVRAAHDRAAGYFERVGNAMTAARHWRAGRRSNNAINVLYRMHEKVVATGELEHLTHLAKALAAEAKDVEDGLFKINTILGSCHNIRGDFEEAESRWRFALANSPSPIHTATIHNKRADSFRLSSNYDMAKMQYDSAITVGQAHDGVDFQSQIARATLGLAKLARLTANYVDAVDRYREALAFFEVTFDDLGIIEAEFGLGEVSRLMNKLDEAEHRYCKSLELSKRTGNLERQAYALWGIGELNRLRELHDEALAVHMEGKDICARVGDTRSAGWAILGIAEIQRQIGQIDEALLTYDYAIDKFSQTQSLTEITHALLGSVEAERCRGPIELERYNKIEETYRGKDLRHALMYCLWSKGAALLQADEVGEAGKVLEEAATLAEHCSLTHEKEAISRLWQERAPIPITLNFP